MPFDGTLDFTLGGGIDPATSTGTIATDPIRDFLSGPDGDLVIAAGDMVPVTGIESIRQDANAVLLFFLGEWFVDQTKGVPYFQQIFAKNPQRASLDQCRSIFRAQLETVLGIVSVQQMDLSFDGPTRTLTVHWQALTDLGVIAGTVSPLVNS